MIDFILWYIYLAVGSWFVLGGLFFAYPTVYRLKDRRDEFSWIMLVPIFCWLIIGAIADIIFNATVGTWVFKELPKLGLRWLSVWKFKIPYPKFELFTDRLKRHHYGKSEKQKKRGAKWVWRVNQIHEGHV